MISDALMKRILFSLLANLVFFLSARAEHITGGEMYYTLVSVSGSDYTYAVTLKLYRDCNSPGAQLDPTAAIAVFEMGSNTMIRQLNVPITNRDRLQLSNPGPCISNPPVVCYEVGFYTTTITVPASAAGYIISYQRCCRINGINNLVASGSVGATYSAVIPGTNRGSTAPNNNSARFVGLDTVIICGGYPFTYSFRAIDPDGDQLRYTFCPAFVGGGQSGQGGSPSSPAPNPPAPPPYPNVNYSFPFNGGAPLGPNVTINPTTGLISGNSPEQGIYVVTVCVEEIRNGVVIATQRKDLQIKAGGCDIAKPVLEPEYRSCDGFTFNFTHPNNPLINTYYWEFGDPASGANNSSTLQNPTHTFTTAGVYTLKLVANRGQECSDSTTAIIRVFPGFFPDFNSSGVCITNPTQFFDDTRANYGVVDNWQWDFGDPGNADVSTDQNPTYQYTTPGVKNVRLIVGSSVGCLDTIIRTIEIIEKPPITLAFKDTLICRPDAVQLQATGTGNFSWAPNTNIVNGNTGTPTVSPTSTTTYVVTLNEQGCINEDSVQVRVVNFVTLSAMNDTTICLTDSVQLNISTDGLQYSWTPTATLNDPTLEDPVATPTATTTYQVQSRIGSCVATENITIRTVPYPVANAGVDTVICYNTPAQLNGSHNGSSFSWSPTASLINPNTLSPTAFPARTQEYVLASFDNLGCPKPGFDTVLVTVLPDIVPFAGNDTLVVVGQPVQFNATGGTSYEWIPATALDNPNIQNPIGIYGPETDSITYTVRVFNDAGCYDSAFIKVTVFKTVPSVFVPTAFSPNGDGLNDELRPVAVGIQRINYLRIYNRWGQMVFSTTTNGAGWDGRISGTPQGSNVFVWMLSAVDYLGNTITDKGTVTLVR